MTYYGGMAHPRPLGRVVPSDWRHVEKYALRAAAPGTVERTLRLPGWHWTHDQFSEGSCVGQAWAMALALMNRRRYDPVELYRAAQRIDEWPGEEYDGTSVRAAGDVLRDRGPVRLWAGKPRGEPSWDDGIQANRWAVSVDEIRASIHNGVPVVIGVDWLSDFDIPTQMKGGEHWLVKPPFTGQLRGGHAVCLYGASDRRQAFRLKNSWGRDYPLVWLPYETMEELLRRDGEVSVITDR